MRNASFNTKQILDGRAKGINEGHPFVLVTKACSFSNGGSVRPNYRRIGMQLIQTQSPEYG